MSPSHFGRTVLGALFGFILFCSLTGLGPWSDLSPFEGRSYGYSSQHHSKGPSGTNQSTSQPPKDYTNSLVVASTTWEDTSWISNNLPELQAFVYIADDPDAPYHPPQNKGREAMIYMTHIIDHYDNLTDVVSFIHAHQGSWHNNDILDFDMAKMLKLLRLEYVVETAPGNYFNLRCHPESGCPASPLEIEGRFNESDMGRNYLMETWEELHGLSPVPESLSAMCCAQFAVSKETIRRTSREQWMEYRDWLMGTSLPDDISGRVWEFTWHYVLSGIPVQCPGMHECYCQGYGLCFDGGNSHIDALLAMKETLFLAEERSRDLEAIPELAEARQQGDVGFHMGQKMRRVLGLRIDQAIIRGKQIHGHHRTGP